MLLLGKKKGGDTKFMDAWKKKMKEWKVNVKKFQTGQWRRGGWILEVWREGFIKVWCRRAARWNREIGGVSCPWCVLVSDDGAHRQHFRTKPPKQFQQQQQLHQCLFKCSRESEDGYVIRSSGRKMLKLQRLRFRDKKTPRVGQIILLLYINSHIKTLKLAVILTQWKIGQILPSSPLVFVTWFLCIYNLVYYYFFAVFIILYFSFGEALISWFRMTFLSSFVHRLFYFLFVALISNIL